MSIVLCLLGSVLAAMLLMLRSTESGYRSVTTAVNMQESGGRALDEIRQRLRAASFVTIAPTPVAPDFFTSTINFQRDLDGRGTLGPAERIGLELVPGENDDGIDNNGNGLVDERRVVWTSGIGTPEERRSVIVEFVREMLGGETANGADDNGNGTIDEGGLSFNFEGRTLNIQLTVERRDADGRLAASNHRASVSIRN